MKLKSIFLLTAMTLFILTNFTDRVSYETNKWDVFEGILQETQGKVVQCEVKTSFELANNNQPNICLQLLKELENSRGAEASTNIIKDESSYSLEFKIKDISGYIESNNNNNLNTVIIDIQQKCGENQLGNINEIINTLIYKAINNRHIELSNKQTFNFLKAELPVVDIHAVNNKVIKLLEKHNSENVNTIDINNGYSTVAYTGRNEYILNQGKKMDVNYAICKYSSSNYLVIGTPILITTY